jgi:hypothetical protein
VLHAAVEVGAITQLHAGVAPRDAGIEWDTRLLRATLSRPAGDAMLWELGERGRLFIEPTPRPPPGTDRVGPSPAALAA